MEPRSVQTAFRFRPRMLTQMKNKARRQGVSLNAYVENLVQNDLDGQRLNYNDLFAEISGLKVNMDILKQALAEVMKWCSILPCIDMQLMEAARIESPDFDDSLQIVCAEYGDCDLYPFGAVGMA